MRIWFIEIGEPLPLEPRARLLRYGQLTAWLAARGHEVVWWACDFSHAAKSHVAAAGDHQLADNLRLVTVHGPGYIRNLSLRRIWHHQVVARAIEEQLQRAAARGGPPDVIVCPIPTVENASVVERFCATHGTPYLLDIRDEWPSEIVRVVPTPLRWLARIALAGQFRAARRVARRAAGVLAVTRRQLAYGLDLAGRAPDPSRDAVFYHGYSRADTTREVCAEAMKWWLDQGLDPTKRIVSFVGTLGASFAVSPIIRAARALGVEGRDDIQFVLAGDGDSRKRLMEETGPLVGKAVLFPGWIDHPRIDALLRVSAAALAPYIPGTSMSLPNKFFEYMAYALPVLSSCSGESEELIRQHRIGIMYDPRDPAGFLRALTDLLDDSAERAEMSRRSEELFESRFQQHLLFEEIERLLQSVQDPNETA